MMSTKLFLQIFVSFTLGSILLSCSSMNSLTVPVTQPALVFLPSSVRSIGIINRSLPSEQNEKMDQIDKILSVEGLNLDKEAAQKTLLGLKDELSISGMFDEVRIIDDAIANNPGMGVFPTVLSWQQINKLCAENDVDVIFALSFYDTDTRVDYDVVPVQIKGPLGLKIPALEHHANTNTQIKTGWRIYDPANQYVVDEFMISKFVEMQGVGINPVNAVKAIVVGRKENIHQVSNQIGHNYAYRLYPSHTRVRRDYYVKGSNNFEVAKRRAQTGDWDGAAELWNEEINNAKGKIVGRAYYNMAISNEINGNLTEAVAFVSKSYTDYNNKEALDYLKLLERRIENDNHLAFQMSQ
jgi:hypothetical protein